MRCEVCAAERKGMMKITQPNGRRSGSGRVGWLTGLLALLLLLGTLASCGKKPPTPDPGTGETDSDSQTEPVTEAPYELPVKKYGGAELKLLIPPGKIWQFEEHAVNTDILNDAIFKRNSELEFAYEIQLKQIYKGNDSTEYNAALNAEMTSQSGSYDICFYPNVYGMIGMVVSSHYFRNLTDMDSIDLSQPWYVQGWNDPCTIEGRLYGAVSYGSVEPMSGAVGVFFNKDMYGSVFDSDPDEMYDLVDAGGWTLEKLEQLSAEAKGDTDGDGVTDRYGLSADFKGSLLVYSLGAEYVVKNESGEYQLNFEDEHNVNVFQRLFRFLNSDSFLYVSGTIFDNNKTFTEGTVLFNLNSFDNGHRIKASEINYGVLPYPKYDGEQKHYITVNAAMGFFSIPTTVDDAEFSAMLLNGLAYYSYEIIRPVYKETFLKKGVSLQSKDSHMIDLIFDSITPDFSYIFRVSFGNHDSKIYRMMIEKNTGYAKYCRENVDLWQSQLDIILGKKEASD